MTTENQMRSVEAAGGGLLRDCWASRVELMQERQRADGLESLNRDMLVRARKAEAERDALLALPDVSREELAMALCEAWRYECEEGVSKYPESWLPVADALLATWRVVRR